MKRFAELYKSLDETTKTSVKLAAMKEYFRNCSLADGAWATYFLSGRRMKRLIKTGLLRECGAEEAGINAWLFEECYGAVGDLAETIALLMPDSFQASEGTLADWVEKRIAPLAHQEDEQRKSSLRRAWQELASQERFVFNKLITGALRVGVSQRLVIRALAETTQLPAALIAHRLMGQWEPTPRFYEALISADEGEADVSKPYPFCLAHPLQQEPSSLGDLGDWCVEWKWDGIRGQVIRRNGEVFLWSRGEELIHERFPEIASAAAGLPDGTVLDGEIVGWLDDRVLPFSELQRRIGRKSVGKKLLAEVPARFLAFDILEFDGHDVRQEPFEQRRRKLEELSQDDAVSDGISLSPLVASQSWEDLAEQREQSRVQNVEGLMLKQRSSQYETGRVTGTWWKWKVDPYTCDAVLIYAQRGHGRRASLYTDYTFAAWHEGQLVPFAKAYSGLTDAQIREVDRFVRKNTLERFGPVRSVKPELVIELAFEDIQPSKRHKSGIAVRFPRMARWRMDKKPEDADSLDSIKRLMSEERLS